MADGLRIIVNGRERLLEGLAERDSLEKVLAALELKADRVAVEHNGEIAPRTSWATTPVMAGDRLEVVHFVGGGAEDCAGPPNNYRGLSTMRDGENVYLRSRWRWCLGPELESH